MNTFLKNYWSLYLDLLEDLRGLNYKGYCIPYLFCHFYSVISENKQLYKQLHKENFSKHLKNHVNHQKEIQGKFNSYVNKHRKSSASKLHEGKVLVHIDKLLRFPNSTLVNDFNRNKTMIISMGKINKKINNKRQILNNGIPIDFFQNYSTDTRSAVKQVQSQAMNIFQSYNNHPLYSNDSFRNVFLVQIENMINRIEEANRFFDGTKISCVVVSTTHSYNNRILALVAAERGIPSICMQHGIISSEFGYIPKVATIDAVYGQFEKDFFMEMGAPEGSVEIIGHPRFDQAFIKPKVNKQKLYNRLGLDRGKKTLMLVVRENNDMDHWRKLIKTISNKMKINILIKNYPSKNPHPLTKEFSSAFPTQGFTLYDIIPHVDCVVAYSSTVGLESMLHGKNVFVLNNYSPDYSGYYNRLGEMVQSNPVKLGSLIVNYFSNQEWANNVIKKRKSFIEYAYPDFTMSGKRLRKLIDRLTKIEG